MDPEQLGWIIAASAAFWVGLAGARVRRELMLLEATGPDDSSYRVVSLMHRLLDDPVALGLRLRFSRLLAASVVPLGLAMCIRGYGVDAMVAAAVAGWWLAAAADISGGRTWARAASRFPRGAGFSVWARLTHPVVRVARPLLRLRVGLAPDNAARGMVLAESRAQLTPTGSRLNRNERRILRRLLASSAILVADIMTGWSEVNTLPHDAGIAEAVAAVKESGRSRLPVMREGRVVGLVTVKDLLALDGGSVPLAHVLRPAYYVREDTTVQGLLDEMQVNRVHLAVVVDRMGREVGLATMEDVLEEIVGELYDEREAPEAAS